MPDQPTIVAAIVTSPQGVLLARWHDGNPEWTFPSGAQETGEGYAGTAVREALEETGLAVMARDLIGERTHPTTGRHMVHIAADPVSGTDVRVGDSDEHSQVGWYPWAMAEGMLPHLFEPVADHLRATFSA
jgi:8-oxo-dGTP diphosphatase